MENCTKYPEHRWSRLCGFTFLEDLNRLGLWYGKMSRISAGFLMPVIGLVGIVSNVLILATLARQKRSSIRLLFQCLAVSDMLFVVLSVWQSLGEYENVIGYALYDVYNLTYWLVKPSVPYVKKVSMYITLLMSVERYLAVCKPMKYMNAMNVKRTLLLVASVVVTMLVYTIASRWQYYTVRYRCKRCDGVVRPGLYVNELYYDSWIVGMTIEKGKLLIIVDWVVEFAVTWPVLVFTNVSIITALYKARTTRREMASSKEATTHSAETEITRSLLAVVILYFFLELPRNFYSIYAQAFWMYAYTTRMSIFEMMDWLIVGRVFPIFGPLCSVLNSSINLYVYILAGKRFRKAFGDLFSWASSRPSRSSAAIDTTKPTCSSQMDGNSTMK